MRYRHDCDTCTPLGEFEHGGRIMDLYHCTQGGDRTPTVVARYGDYGPDYTSGLISSDPALAEAMRRAKEKGLPV